MECGGRAERRRRFGFAWSAQWLSGRKHASLRKAYVRSAPNNDWKIYPRIGNDPVSTALPPHSKRIARGNQIPPLTRPTASRNKSYRVLDRSPAILYMRIVNNRVCHKSDLIISSRTVADPRRVGLAHLLAGNPGGAETLRPTAQHPQSLPQRPAGLSARPPAPGLDVRLRAKSRRGLPGSLARYRRRNRVAVRHH